LQRPGGSGAPCDVRRLACTRTRPAHKRGWAGAGGGPAGFGGACSKYRLFSPGAGSAGRCALRPPPPRSPPPGDPAAALSAGRRACEPAAKPAIPGVILVHNGLLFGLSGLGYWLLCDSRSVTQLPPASRDRRAVRSTAPPPRSSSRETNEPSAPSAGVLMGGARAACLPLQWLSPAAPARRCSKKCAVGGAGC
jgi:hypothetical protein